MAVVKGEEKNEEIMQGGKEEKGKGKKGYKMRELHYRNRKDEEVGNEV